MTHKRIVNMETPTADSPRETVPPYWRHEQAVERGRRGARVAAGRRARRKWNETEARRAWWNQ
jgi:hypothetical protein